MKYLRLFMYALMLIQGSFASASTSSTKTLKVGIVQIIQHQSLDELRKSALEQLKVHGFKDVVIDYQNANGNSSLLSQICSQMLKRDYDVIFAIGTSAAQMAIARNSKIPVVFAPISDPVGSKLVKSMSIPGGIATGTTDRVDYLALLNLIKEISPGVKKLGLPFNPGEVNSIATFSEILKISKTMKFKIPMELVSVGVNDISSVSQGLQTAISQGVDALLLTQDNTIATAVDNVIRISAKRGIPVYSTFNAAVAKGAFASLGIDYAELGKITGDILVRVLKKENPGHIPVQGMSQFELLINLKHAKEMKITLSDSFLKRAKTIYGQQ